MKIGHISLEAELNRAGEDLVCLVESLANQGVEQHVVLRNQALAQRLSIADQVTVGPTTSAASVAYCLMPPVDVVHTHSEKSAQAGLLLALTRSIPYVVTRRSRLNPDDHTLIQSIYRRAGSVICTTDAGARALVQMDASIKVDVIPDARPGGENGLQEHRQRAAALLLRVYHRVADSRDIPALLL